MAAAAPAEAATIDERRRGWDKVSAPAAGLYMTTVITFAYKPRGDAQERLEQHAARAFKELSEAHPRMRSQLKRDAAGREIHAASIVAELSDAAVARSVSVRRGDWKAITESVADAGFTDMYSAPLFSVCVVPPPAEGEEGHVIFASAREASGRV
jgi:hypothetical protein